jgi:hypothetical protein
VNANEWDETERYGEEETVRELWNSTCFLKQFKAKIYAVSADDT